MRFPAKGLYAITQTENRSADEMAEAVSAAIRGGAAVIQYRDKAPENADTLATKLLEICHNSNVPLIINDNIDLAVRIGADGVHLGREDENIGSARRMLGKDKIIGISCYDSIERAIVAESRGADYVAFGRFFPSGTKPLASPAQISTLQQAKIRIHVPIVAIGGILPKNGSALLAAGADLLAVIGGIFDHDPEQSARKFQALFDKTAD